MDDPLQGQMLVSVSESNTSASGTLIRKWNQKTYIKKLKANRVKTGRKEEKKKKKSCWNWRS